MFVLQQVPFRAVRDLVATAFESVGLDWKHHVVLNTSLLRQDEHFQLVANPSKAKRNLGWEPQVSFEELLEKMVKTDLERLQRGAFAPSPRV